MANRVPIALSFQLILIHFWLLLYVEGIAIYFFFFISSTEDLLQQLGTGYDNLPMLFLSEIPILFVKHIQIQGSFVIILF